MAETAVMTLRMPRQLKQGVERLAARFGHKPAQTGVRLIEEALRKRDFPHIDLRETAAGRVAYVAGTRFAVYWVAAMVPARMTAEAFANQYSLPAERVRAALAYAHAFRGEIRSAEAHAQANQAWIESQDAGWRPRPPANRPGKPRRTPGSRR